MIQTSKRVCEGRFDLSDLEWAVIKPLLADKVRGVARGDDGRIIWHLVAFAHQRAMG